MFISRMFLPSAVFPAQALGHSLLCLHTCQQEPKATSHLRGLPLHTISSARQPLHTSLLLNVQVHLIWLFIGGNYRRFPASSAKP
ncbi:hypothetical protein B0T25DRAFT_168532 [Lasiosphaeria hispida]|uniref:Secreted protein n=1 Tax=Lasiosphaeria hispida TaxID=260671 RepID=A0AAJ0HNB6_9PEZI|nr:hypothetical protein B0T25DRAFT_168532 [Lasiosphaeria hispida]